MVFWKVYAMMHSQKNIKKFILLSFISSVGIYRTASSSNLPTYLGSICRCIFFPFGIHPDGTFTGLVRGGSHISLEKKIHVGLQEMDFQWHVASQGTVWGKWILHDVYLVSWIFFISQKSLQAFSNASQSLPRAPFNLCVKSEVLEKSVLLENRQKRLLLSWPRLRADNFYLT